MRDINLVISCSILCQTCSEHLTVKLRQMQCQYGGRQRECKFKGGFSSYQFGPGGWVCCLLMCLDVWKMPPESPLPPMRLFSEAWNQGKLALSKAFVTSTVCTWFWVSKPSFAPFLPKLVSSLLHLRRLQKNGLVRFFTMDTTPHLLKPQTKAIQE